jgi:hypothetical protein
VPKGMLFVATSPSPERDADYNDWYNDIHVIDILKLSGFTSARRFRKLVGEGHPYAAVYEVDAEDLQEAFTGLGVAVANGDVRMTDALAMDPAPSMVLYEQIYERSE